MKKIDFANGKIPISILRATGPMLAAQLLNLLYNIVDRIYIARIEGIGTTALGAIGICFPVIVIIQAFSSMYGSGGAPLFSIERGKGNDDAAARIQSTAYTLLIGTALVLTAVGMVFAGPILRAFGASEEALAYALPYMRIYLIGTLPSMLATGMNPYINAQGYASTGMISVVIGAAANIVLDPLFIFTLGLGIEGAAIATILSQAMSAVFVVRTLKRRSELKIHLLTGEERRACGPDVRNIIGLGSSSFVMQFTNSLVTICANNVLLRTGGDLFISIMTIVSSVRQMVETPIFAIVEGASPLISFNYGARKPRRVIYAVAIMAAMTLVYAGFMWGFIVAKPEFLISIFSSDRAILTDAIPALKLYFTAFIFMCFQYTGQTVFKSLNKKKQAIFFSLLRKVVIVVPLTFLLPYVFGMGTDGVFAAEPVSNVIGGLLCFITMLLTVLPELKQMEKADAQI
ncbi:MAG: MATE family efflux transporter [Eubacterium sp.]|nr:MATE family efflux transporter [Eubacterium sp.]